jgi:hypothetical protein
MTANPFKPGDQVKLRFDVLQRHSRSIPAHAGFTKEAFRWREILSELEGKTGVVERISSNSKHTNVNFKGHKIGIDWTELVKVGGIKIVRLSNETYLKNKKDFAPTVRSRVRAEIMASNHNKKTIYVLPDGKHVVRK